MDDLHELAASRAFRPHRRPLLIAVIANVLLFGSLVVWPYVRGQLRAADDRARFARFAACFWGGAEEEDPGLELPPGERERYAGQVLRGPEGWPEGCRAALAAVAPDEPWLLFPGAKQAEAQIRGAVSLVRSELEALAEARRAGVGAVPDRPHLAVGRLRASLAIHHQVTGAADDMAGPAIRFEGEGGLPEPARVPLSAAGDAVTHLALLGDGDRSGLAATAVDARGVSRVVVVDGRVDVRRVRRPRLVRGAVHERSGHAGAAGRPWLVWAMDEGRCAQEEQRCAGHAVGLAALPDDAIRTPEPRWYAAHPEGRIDRSVRVQEDGAWIVARGAAEESAEARWFPFEAPGNDAGAELAADAGAPPAVAARAIPLEGLAVDHVAMLMPGHVLWTRAPLAAEGGVTLVRAPLAAEGGEPAALVTVDGERPWLLGCHAQAAPFVLLGTSTGAHLVRAADTGAAAAPLSLALGAPLHPDDPQRDRARLLCDGERALVVALDDGGVLSAIACGPDARCQAPVRVAAQVHRFDAAMGGDTAVLAWSRDGPRAPVHAARLVDGALGDGSIPAACWQSEEGFCGAPWARADGRRFVLGAREGTDMLVIESTDAGRTWTPLRAIR